MDFSSCSSNCWGFTRTSVAFSIGLTVPESSTRSTGQYTATLPDFDKDCAKASPLL